MMRIIFESEEDRRKFIEECCMIYFPEDRKCGEHDGCTQCWRDHGYDLVVKEIENENYIRIDGR